MCVSVCVSVCACVWEGCVYKLCVCVCVREKERECFNPECDEIMVLISADNGNRRLSRLID